MDFKRNGIIIQRDDVIFCLQFVESISYITISLHFATKNCRCTMKQTLKDDDKMAGGGGGGGIISCWHKMNMVTGGQPIYSGVKRSPIVYRSPVPRSI